MKYKSFKIIVLAVFVLLTAVLIKPTNVSAGCMAQTPTWSPSSASWSKVAIPATFNFSQIDTYVFDDPSLDTTNTITDSCTTTAVNGAKCTVFGLNKIAYPSYMACPSNRGASWSSPVNHIDTVAPTCGTWSGSGPRYTLSGSTDTGNTGGNSGINVAGGNCTATSGNTCTVNISDIAGNTTTCTSPTYGAFTVSASAGIGGTVDPTTTPRTVTPGDTTTFKLLPDTVNNYAVDTSYVNVTGNLPDSCLQGNFFADNVTYKTGTIGANNCVYNFKFKNTSVVNGSCGATPSNPTHYNCATGTSSLTPADTSTQYNWTCLGSGTGHTDAVCTESKTPPPTISGTLTATNCYITAGNNSCPTTLNWTTSPANPPSMSAVTTPTSVTVANGNSGTTTYPVVGVSPNGTGTRTFYLYNNNVELSPAGGVVATASCATGTQWDIPTGTCKLLPGVMTGTLTPSPTSCAISTVGGTTCNVNLSWTTTNPPVGSTSAVSSAGGGTEGYGDNGGPQAFSVPRGSRTFYLYNTAVELASSTATAECASPLVWDPSIGSCQNNSTAMTGTLTTTLPSCLISSGGSSCTIKLNWSIAHPVGIPTSITAIGMTNVDVTNTLITPQSGSKVSVPVPYGTRTFHLFNNGVELAFKDGNGVCTSFTGWDGTKCSAAAYCVSPAVWNGVSCAAPLCSPLRGNACTASNSCGSLTNSGLFGCDGVCSATPPSEAGCVATPGGTTGVCALTHYNCSVGNVNVPSEKSNTSNFTWKCDGLLGGASSPTCTELKKKPIFIEN